MTLAEKIGQLTQFGEYAPSRHDAMIRAGRIGSLLNIHGAAQVNRLQELALRGSRLAIPLLIANDVIHGYQTIFPIPLAEAASWSPRWAREAAQVAAREAAAAGTRWTFAPMVDIARDPRWGRVAEGAGEDPYLGAAFAAARVRGFQGRDLAHKDAVLACAKHFVAYGAAEAGRDYNTVDISRRTLREVHFPPFRAAVRAGVATLMTAFNDINGVPASANRWTLTDVLRGQWGFGGLVVSDWRSVAELRAHGFAATDAEAARKALVAGVDIEMQAGVYDKTLGALVASGQLAVARIDAAVRRVLRLKLALGLFDGRARADAKAEAATMLRADHLQLALEVARRSIVLLKNDPVRAGSRGAVAAAPALPLSKTLRRIALIGPLAASRTHPLGPWAAKGDAKRVSSVLDGVRRKISPRTQLIHVAGCPDARCRSSAGFAAAVRAMRRADAAVIVVGEPADMSGEAASRTQLSLPGKQLELLQRLARTGKPLIVVLMNGRPLALPWLAKHASAIVEAWFLGTRAGDAIADVLFGDFNPGGKLPITFPRTVGQVPIYYAHKNTGRPPSDKDKFTSKYIDAPVTPLYPFGFGLSYTRFAFDALELSAKTISADGTLSVSVVVHNRGPRSGDEVVQLYMRDVNASVTRPVKQLRGFRRVTLAAGASERVTFKLTAHDLSLVADVRSGRRVVEPGQFRVWVGPSSVEGSSATFAVVGGTKAVKESRR